ncbi:hypothetical protein N9N67_07635 [Bacteriovoracaceae bacterium]|nr:hypothetical protein [Bacteriovoracaceae bacterium]
MENSYWLKKWEQNDIGFHKNDTHPYLLNHFSSFIKDTHNNVFVPLCGKTIDMVYLAQKKLHVTGVELSEEAIRAFFNENSIDFTINSNVFSSPQVDLIQEDLFKIKVNKYDLIYDRASFIAIDPNKRNQYWDKLKILMHEKSYYFLILLEHIDIMTKRPPFPVTPGLVYDYWGKDKVNLIHQEKVIPPPKHSDYDQEGWTESAYIIEL